MSTAARRRTSGRAEPPQDVGLRLGRGWAATSVRHLAVGALTAVLVAGFWASRMDWSPDMRLWRAIGDAAVVLLFVCLAMGPAARLSRAAARALTWRRYVGVWAALAALTHSVLIIDGWAQWSVRRFLGYEVVAQLGREVRLEPGFGLANLMGLVAAAWLLVLLATSSDRAVRLLGGRSWKWLHGGITVVFYLAVLHAGYFLFIHYTASFHRAPPPPNWFRFPMLVMALTVLALQWAAFARTVARGRARAVQAR